MTEEKERVSTAEVSLIVTTIVLATASLYLYLKGAPPAAPISGFFAGLLGNFTASTVGQNHYGKQPCKSSIFDIGYATTPQIKMPRYILEMYSYAPFLFLMAAPTFASNILGDIAVRMGVVLSLKAITTVVTVLPSPDPCEAETFSWRHFVSSCYDKVFSGHTAFAVICSLAMAHYGVWPLWAGWIYSLGMSLILLVTRGHYTVDIVLGAAVGYLTWCKADF